MLSYHVHPGTGPHLLLAHGALSNSAQWALNLPALRKFCTPVTVELLGHGDSPSPTDLACYRPEAYVAYFETIREALGAERWFLCGYSLSASLTIRYALEHPERVIGHCLTNSNSAFAGPELMAEWAASGPQTMVKAEAQGRKFLERMPIHPRLATALPKAVYTPLLERSALLDPLGASKTLALTAPTASVRSRLSENSRPALLLAGRREKRFMAEVDFAKATMPLLEVKELDAGHGVNMQAADEFNALIKDFVSACAT